MANMKLGRTVVIANPAAQSGRGADAAERVGRFFEAFDSASDSFALHLTSGGSDGARLAGEAADADTVIALGGDGIIHEVINGLMTIDEDSRPKLGVIPMGSGNDYARTLGITFNRPEEALAELLSGSIMALDLGYVSSDAGTSAFFAESLSFGLDAAIALDTIRRREKGTPQRGEVLFASSALRIVSSGAVGHPVDASFDGGPKRQLEILMFAVQVGPTYGGGFRICPGADPTDGKLDVCFNMRRARVPHLLFLLGLARFGHHVSSRVVETDRVEEVKIDFEGGEPPCQVDGEPLCGSRFWVRCVPQALKVIVPASFRW